MKSINWKQMAELGLVRKINNDILHPLGLALSYDPGSGISTEIYVDEDDWKWEYSEEIASKPFYSEDEIKAKVKEMIL